MRQIAQREKVKMKAIIRTIIVVILIAAVAAIGWLSYGFREWDPNAWKGEIEDLTAQEPVVDGDGNELDPDGVNPLPSAMTFSSALNLAGEATSVTVHATINPSTVADTFKALDWSVAWNDPDSAWAFGKTVTDYVTVTPISDGAATATIACSQAFGEQIVLTCASRYFTSVKTTATIDYRAKVNGFSATYHYSPPTSLTDNTQQQHEFDVLIDSTKSAVYIDVPTIDNELIYPGNRYEDSWGYGWGQTSIELDQSIGSVGVIDSVDGVELEVKLDAAFVTALEAALDDAFNEFNVYFDVPTDWYSAENDFGAICFAGFFNLNATAVAQELGFPAVTTPTVWGLTSSQSTLRDYYVILQLSIVNALNSYLSAGNNTFAQLRVTPIDVELDADTIESGTFVLDLGLIDYATDVDFVTSITLDDAAIEF